MALSLRRIAHPRVPAFTKSRLEQFFLSRMMRQISRQLYLLRKCMFPQWLRPSPPSVERLMVKRGYGISKDNHFDRLSLQNHDNPFCENLGAQRPAKISGAPFRFGDRGVERAFDADSSLRKARIVAPLAEPGQQHRRGADQ